MKKKMNSSPRVSKDPLTQQTPAPRRRYHGTTKKPKKAAAKKTPKPAEPPVDDGKPKIPETREDIQAPYKFSEEEIAIMNHGLRNALDDMDTLRAQAKAAAQDFKLRITNRENEAKQFRNKLAAGEETRPMKAAVDFNSQKGIKRYLHPETGEFIREEPMTPADWQLPMFKPEEVQSTKPAEKPAPAAKGAGKAPKTSPAGETNVGDAMDKAAAGTKAPQVHIDKFESDEWSQKALTDAFKKAAKKAKWTAPQISVIADRLAECADVSAMRDTLRPFVIVPETVEVAGVNLPRVDAELPDGFPLEKVTGIFRKGASKAEWPEAATDEVVNEAERQARVIGDEPEATEAATRYLRNFCVTPTIET